MDTQTIVSSLSAVIAVASVAVAIIALNHSARSAAASQTSANAAQISAAAAERSNEIAGKSVEAADRSNELAARIFRRQEVVEVAKLWMEVHNIDPTSPDGPSVSRAISAMALTATLWMHDVMDKEIIYQDYWRSYQTLFNRISGLTQPISGLGANGPDLLTDNIRRVHREMTDFRPNPSTTI